MLTILDFNINPQEKNKYRLEIFERDSSQPLVQSCFDYDLSYMTQFEINQIDFTEKAPSERMDRLKGFGKKLYDSLFTAEVQKLWQDYKEKKDFLVLCLRIAPKASGLEILPWETLFDGEEFIAAGAKTGLTRLPLDIKIQKKLPALTGPLKMLAFMSSPLDLEEKERLQIEREQEILLQAVNTPAGQGKLHIDFEDEAKLPVLENSLETDYHIFHYSGHGIPPEHRGGLLLEDANGRKKPYTVTEFLQSFQKGEKKIRLAVISGCQTARTLYTEGFHDLARGLARHRIPAVIAMQFSISDSGGLLFAENLYTRLVDGQALESALSATRRELLFSDKPCIQADAFAPVLISSNSRPLQIRQTKKVQTAIKPEIDFSFYLQLPRLDFGFYGRRREYRAIRDGLIHKNIRAIIVHGIGGIGKTALISYSAIRLKQHFKGVYGFDCSSGTLAPETILLELHRYLERQNVDTLKQLLHQSLPPDQLASFMSQVLNQWPLLIIFDNFESQLVHRNRKHEIENENLRIFLMTLIKTTSQATRFLFTTRKLFNVDEKRIGTIQEIPLGDLSRPETLGLMQKLPHLSGASFKDKIKAFETFGGHPYALVTLDRHCTSKPLTQVLKDAANVREDIREFLAIELNYRSLSERSRELLNRISAFRKPVSTDAVHWVMGQKVKLSTDVLKTFNREEMPEEMQAMNDEELLRLIQKYLPEQRHAKNIDKPVQELISWGLLTPLEQDAQVRSLTVHSLVRDFCREKQKSETWRDKLRDAAAYYTNETRLVQKDEKTSAAVWNEMEAFELLFEAGDFEDAASLIIRDAELLDRWGFGRYSESLHKRIMHEVKRETKSDLMHNMGNLLQNRGDYASALTEYKKSLKIKEELGDRAGVARSLNNIGAIHQGRGDYASALTEYEKSLKIDEELDNRAGMASSMHNIGAIYQSRGDYASALKEYKKSLKIFKELGDRLNVARSLHQIGAIHQERGDYSSALTEYEKSLKIGEELGDRAGVARSMHQIGRIHQSRGDNASALTEYEKSLKIFEKLGDRTGVGISLHQIGMIHQERGDYTSALTEFEKSLKIFEELGDREDVARSLNNIGAIHQSRGDNASALAEYEKSLKIFEELGDRAGVARSLYEIGRIHQSHGDYASSLTEYEKSLKIFEELSERVGATISLFQIGMIHQSRGDNASALTKYEKLLIILEDLGDHEGTAFIHGLMGDLFIQVNKYDEAFENLMFALAAFIKLESPSAKTVINDIKNIRDAWGAENFDAAWRDKTGEDVPEGLKGEG